MMKAFLVFFGTALLVTASLEASAPILKAVDVLVARDVLAKQPVDPSEEFPADVGSVICWAKLYTPNAPRKIWHVWYYNNREMSRIPIEIKSSKWRAWSKKTIHPWQIGSWRVELRDEGGVLIESVDFKIAASLEAASEPLP